MHIAIKVKLTLFSVVVVFCFFFVFVQPSLLKRQPKLVFKSDQFDTYVRDDHSVIVNLESPMSNVR